MNLPFGMRNLLPRLILLIGVASASAGGGLGLRQYLRYPSAPDPKTSELSTAIEFMAGEEFNRLSLDHRRRYALEVVRRHEQMDLPSLLGTMMDPQKRATMQKVARNFEQMPRQDREKVGVEMAAMFLRKYYEQPLGSRQAYLTMLVQAEKMQRMAERLSPKSATPAGEGVRPRRGLPSPEEVKRFMWAMREQMDPQTQAQWAQFMQDLRRTREKAGLKD